MKMSIALLVVGLAIGCGPSKSPAEKIHAAARAGDAKEVQKLLTKDPSLASTADQWSLTPLHDAAARGNQAVVEALLSHGADVNARSYGVTPLMSAVINGHEGVVSVLLAHKADPNVQGADGKTALQVATDKGQPKIAALLRQAGATE